MFEGSFLPYLHDCGRSNGPRREGEYDYTGRLLQVRGGGDIDIVSVVTGEFINTTSAWNKENVIVLSSSQ